MRFFLTILAFFFTIAQAAPKTPAAKAGDLIRHVKKGSSITVLDYDQNVRAFVISLREEPAVGPNYAEPGEFRKAVEFEGEADSMLKKKEQIIGSVFQLKKPLLLLTENQVLQRRKKK